jgi:hypothetical protein
MLSVLATVGDRGLLILGGLAFACVASAWYLWSSRAQADVRALRAFAWVTLIGAVLLLAFFAYILWFADFSWMNQK